MEGAGGPEGANGSSGVMTRAGEMMVRRLSDGQIGVDAAHSGVFMSLPWLRRREWLWVGGRKKR